MRTVTTVLYDTKDEVVEFGEDASRVTCDSCGRSGYTPTRIDDSEPPVTEADRILCRKCDP